MLYAYVAVFRRAACNRPCAAVTTNPSAIPPELLKDERFGFECRCGRAEQLLGKDAEGDIRQVPWSYEIRSIPDI